MDPMGIPSPKFELQTKRKKVRIIRIADQQLIATFDRDAEEHHVIEWLAYFNGELFAVKDPHEGNNRNRPGLGWSAGLRELKRLTQEPELDPYTWRGPGEKNLPIDAFDGVRPRERIKFDSDY